MTLNMIFRNMPSSWEPPLTFIYDSTNGGIRRLGTLTRQPDWHTTPGTTPGLRDVHAAYHGTVTLLQVLR